MSVKRDAAISAIAHCDMSIGALQSVQGYIDDSVTVARVQEIQRLILAVEEKIKTAFKIKPEPSEVFLPAFPKSSWVHIKPRRSYRHKA